MVVDDGSPDGTADAVRAVSPIVGNVHLLERPGKLGLGSAYRTAFGWALEHGFDVVVTMDVDFSHDPAVIPHMIRLIEGRRRCSIIGSRVRLRRGATAVLAAASTGCCPVGETGTPPSCSGSRLRDLHVRDFALIVLRRSREINAESGTAPEGYAFLTELVHRLVHGHLRVIETPIVFRVPPLRVLQDVVADRGRVDVAGGLHLGCPRICSAAAGCSAGERPAEVGISVERFEIGRRHRRDGPRRDARPQRHSDGGGIRLGAARARRVGSACEDTVSADDRKVSVLDRVATFTDEGVAFYP